MEFASLMVVMDTQRSDHGFLPVTAMLDALTSSGNTLLDPFSTLISAEAVIGRNNVLYPNVTFEVRNGGSITIGSGNTFYPGCLLLADGGHIHIGDDNQFGGGGLQLLAFAGAALHIGSSGRYMNGADISAPCTLGNGSQIIGPISARNCQLGAGHSHQHPDSSERGGVLKGVGRAHNLTVGMGEVINGSGSFSQSGVESQLAYHPRKS